MLRAVGAGYADCVADAARSGYRAKPGPLEVRAVVTAADEDAARVVRRALLSVLIASLSVKAHVRHRTD